MAITSRYGEPVEGSSSINIIGDHWHRSALIYGVYGVGTRYTNALPVVVDSRGWLGTINSSRRFKEDIRDIGDVSEALHRLRPVSFRYREAEADGGEPRDYGLVAEEVAEELPELVIRDDEGEPQTVRYHVLPVLLLNELQRQARQLADCRSELAELRSAVAQQAETLREILARQRELAGARLPV